MRNTTYSAVVILIGLLAAAVPMVSTSATKTAATPPARKNATITFYVHGQNGLDRQTRVLLSARKAGRLSLVAGQPGPGEADGFHSFTLGETATNICQYYAGFLQSCGWSAGVDFLVSGTSIHFYSMDAIAADCDSRQLAVGLSRDGG